MKSLLFRKLTFLPPFTRISPLGKHTAKLLSIPHEMLVCSYLYSTVQLLNLDSQTRTILYFLWEAQKEQSPNLKTFKKPRNRFQGIDSAGLCNMAAAIR